MFTQANKTRVSEPDWQDKSFHMWAEVGKRRKWLCLLVFLTLSSTRPHQLTLILKANWPLNVRTWCNFLFCEQCKQRLCLLFITQVSCENSLYDSFQLILVETPVLSEISQSLNIPYLPGWPNLSSFFMCATSLRINTSRWQWLCR